MVAGKRAEGNGGTGTIKIVRCTQVVTPGRDRQMVSVPGGGRLSLSW